MSNQTPQTLKGFRDFLPAEKRKRDFVLKSLTTTAESFGFEPLETPTLEYASLLLGKYGDEADKLVYTFTDKGDRAVGLRYDQTVPTARVLSQYQHLLPTYFRRYQAQNVFRADKPQKGRFREFQQFDIDIFGSTHPIADAEILAATFTAFKKLGFSSIQLLVNDRQSLVARLTPFTTDQVSVFSLIQSIDKLDKLSPEQVISELVAKGLDAQKAQAVISSLKSVEIPENLAKIMELAKNLGVPQEALVFSPALARGLDYYTGMIFEIRIPEYTVGSVGGGGRYDKLINDLGGPQVPAVGMAFGFDRIVEAAIELHLLPAAIHTAQVLVTVFDDTTLTHSLKCAAALRQAGINCQIYPEVDKMGKQIKTANDQKIPYVAIIGPEEGTKNVITLKNLETGEQETLTIPQVATKLRKE